MLHYNTRYILRPLGSVALLWTKARSSTYFTARELRTKIAIYIALLLPFGLLILPSLQATMAGDVAGLDPMAAIGHMGGLLLYYIVLMAMLLVLNNAAYRAVLRPRDSRYAYLRVGMDELRILGLGIAVFLVFFLIEILIN